jgi:hypothetical protein
MNEAIAWIPTQVSSRTRLTQAALAGQLYVMVDPFFQIPLVENKLSLEIKDTDPLFYDVIAWDQVTYEPPYIAKIDEATLDWVLNSLSTERWGIFIVSQDSAESLVAHYQKFVIARGPDQNPYFLRFHDASVLEVLLRTWEPKEKAVFFGPTNAFGLPDLDTLDVSIEENPFSQRPRALPAPEDCLIHLRSHQLTQCSDAIDRDLIKVIYWHLRNHHPKCIQFLDKNTLQSRVHYAIHKARGYKLATVSDLAGFAALMFELSPNFDEHPSFKKILQDSSIPAEVKMRKLSQVITDREWDEAAQLYDRKFWLTALKKPVR